MAKGQERPYDASDLKELMDNTGGWARNWDDVLRYLHGPAVRDADFSKAEVPALIHDIEEIKNRGIKFSEDYRDTWKAISGEKADNLPPPEGIKKPPTDPIELEDKFLKGLSFPAAKKDVVKRAQSNKAPKRVTDVLEKIDDKMYRDMPGLLEAVGDKTWDHD